MAPYIMLCVAACISILGWEHSIPLLAILAATGSMLYSLNRSDQLSRKRELDQFILKERMAGKYKILAIFFGETKANLLLYGEKEAINFYISKYPIASKWTLNNISELEFTFLEQYINLIHGDRKSLYNSIDVVLLKTLILAEDGFIHESIIKEIDNEKNFQLEKALRELIAPTSESYVCRLYREHTNSLSFDKLYQVYDQARSDIGLFYHQSNPSKEKMIERYQDLYPQFYQEIIDQYY